jgi:asparagine synthase (glutamine-hydrolysing)
MTAIAGLWYLCGKPNSGDGCARILSAQELFGRDGTAQWENDSISLGRCLTRSVPEDVHDSQPLLHGDRWALVGDLRLDNRAELIESLQIPKERSHVLCDAAILLAAFEKWQDTCFDHIVGDYAFAVWDRLVRRLVLARDPIGQRPLHYHRGNGYFAFASMPKGLHSLPEVPYLVDEDRIVEFLALLPETGPQSFFKGIDRVEAGHVVTVTESGVSARRHWNPIRRRIILKTANDYAEALRFHLDQAVHCRLRGAREVGAHLSGGLDSSAVAATAARILAPLGRRIVAFTHAPRQGYDQTPPRNRIVDESGYAAATAALYTNMDHVIVRDSGRSQLDDLERSFLLFDQPISGLCNLGWANSINDAARARKVNVLLTGLDGNMTLSYNGMELLPELLRGGRWLRLWREARGLAVNSQMRWRGILAQTFGPWFPGRLWRWINAIYQGRRDENPFSYTPIHPTRITELNLLALAEARGLDLTDRPSKDSFLMRLWVLRRSDPGNYNKGVLGGWQIDLRDPTSDVRLIEFCLSIPTEQFLSNGVSRALAKRALADRVPQFVLDEWKRGYQAADWHERLTSVRERIADELDRIETCSVAARTLDLRRLRKLTENWPTVGWESDEIIDQYRGALVRGISAGYFLRRAVGSNS